MDFCRFNTSEQLSDLVSSPSIFIYDSNGILHVTSLVLAGVLQVGEQEDKLAESIKLMCVKSHRSSKRAILTDLITVRSPLP